jgi:hypothetical protein
MALRNWNRAAVMLIPVFLVGRVCFGFDDGDFQYWATAKARFDINKDWHGTVAEEFRLGDDAEKLYYRHTELGLVTSPADWLDLGFNYRQVAEKDSRDKWIWENRPHLNITLKTKLFNLALSDRSRFEYRDRENKEDIWRYRNKLTLKFPIELTSLKMQPYLADEVFIDFGRSDISRNRFYAGLSVKLSENVFGNVFYLCQSSESSRGWKDIHVLGTQLELRF